MTADEVRAWAGNWREWFPASYSIMDEEGTPVPFQLRPAQERLFQRVQDIRARNKPVRIQFLKARRVNISAAVAALLSRMLYFIPGMQGIVVAHDAKAAALIYDYYLHFHRTYKPERGVLPILPIVASRANEYIEIEGGGRLAIGTANNPNVGRSMKIMFAHLSETAFWRDSVTARRALLSTIPNSPATIVIDESTANGVGTPHHRNWVRNSSGQGGLWETEFFPWWKHPLNFLDLAPADIAQIEATFGAYPDEEEHARLYDLSWGQIAWRRMAIDTICDGAIESFRQEYPANPEEAFISSGYCRFQHAALARQPILEDAPLGTITREPVGTTKVPVFTPGERGPVWMASQPAPQRRYIIGVDVAQGIDTSKQIGTGDPDYSVADVYDLASGEQVATIRGRIDPFHLADLVSALGEMYNFAFICPEVNGQGVAFIRELLRHGYPIERLYVHDRAPHDLRPPELHEIGFKTTTASRPILIQALDSALLQRRMHIRNPITISEAWTFTVNPSGKAEAQSGCHDDCVLAAALAAIGWDQAYQREAIERAKTSAGAGRPKSWKKR